MGFLHPEHLIETFGLAGLLTVILVESGIFPAPLPGDSLLFTAGLFAAADRYGLHIVPIAVGSFACDRIDNVDRYLLPIVAVIVLVSLIPPALEYRKHRRKQAAAAATAASPNDSPP